MNWQEQPSGAGAPGLNAGMRRLSRRKFLNLAGRAALGVALASSGGMAYVSRLEPRWYQLEQVELRLPRLGHAFDGFRLAQVSDIHLSKVTGGEQLEEVVQMILSQRPDLVAITGDFVDRESEVKDPLSILVDVLRPLAKEAPVVSVLGNHDYNVGAERVRSVLHASGIAELPNAVLPIERGGDRLYVAGVDDLVFRRARLSWVMRDLPEDYQAAILLVHEPDFADSASMTGRFDLQISGHSHGGQVVLPFFGPLVLPNYAVKYISGLYQVGGMFQYTNRGLGGVPPRVRFNSRPEITLFTLRSGR